MKTFPSTLTPANIKKLSEYRFNRQLCYTRRWVFESMLSPEFNIPKNCGINLESIGGELGQGQYSVDERVTTQIEAELRALGWETMVAYGGSMLFVYSPGNKPDQAINCTSLS